MGPIVRSSQRFSFECQLIADCSYDYLLKGFVLADGSSGPVGDLGVCVGLDTEIRVKHPVLSSRCGASTYAWPKAL